MVCIFRLISLLAFLVTALWLYSKPAWDSASAAVVTLSFFIGTYIGNAEQKKAPLSKEAKKLLQEIDSSTHSEMKGISLMMIDAVRGFYRPFIWSNSKHGSAGGELNDMGIILSAVHELENKGFLAFESQPSKSLSYYRRTDKKRGSL